jgi:tRNA U34 5-methylaminomethyl-2-thiouridine-forming methyltransferase MnmC
MEREHMACSAGEPYRDPSGIAAAAAIRADRREVQAASLTRGERTSSSAWRRRWGLSSGSAQVDKNKRLRKNIDNE